MKVSALEKSGASAANCNCGWGSLKLQSVLIFRRVAEREFSGWGS